MEQLNQAQTQSQGAEDQFMSDREAQKWLQELNKTPISHIYKLESIENKNNQKASENEKPW